MLHNHIARPISSNTVPIAMPMEQYFSMLLPLKESSKLLLPYDFKQNPSEKFGDLKIIHAQVVHPLGFGLLY